MQVHPELKSTLRWTAAVSVPLTLVGFYLANAHAGPGGHYFLLGMVVLLPMFALGLPLSQYAPNDLILPVLLAVQFTYWAVFVFAVRWLWHGYRPAHSGGT